VRGEGTTKPLRRLPRSLISTREPLVLVAVLLGFSAAPATAAALNVEAFTTTARNADGTIDELAGTHPFVFDVHVSTDAGRAGGSEGHLHEVQVSLPPGLIGSSLNVPRCPAMLLLLGTCSGASQIGMLRGIVPLGEVSTPLYNVTPEIGHAAAFGITINNGISHESFVQQLRLVGTGTSSSIHLSGSVPPSFGLSDIDEEIWGIPADSDHDPERICQLEGGESTEGCSSGAEIRPFLTLPASCSGPLSTSLAVTSFGASAVTTIATALSLDAAGTPRPLAGCAELPFDPRLTVQSGSAALAPSALAVGIEMPLYEGAGLTGAASLAGLRLELPDGLALNPSAGSWLSGCSPTAIGLESAPGIEPPIFDENGAECPSSSRLGTVKLTTPLIDHRLDGSIYLATPTANPFGARFVIYLVIDDEASGTILKIPGRLEADPSDGRLTATIPELPPFPVEDLKFEFSGGPRAPLVSPSSCGEFGTAATFTPSTAPFGSLVRRTAGFTLGTAAGGSPCPPAEAERGSRPAFQAGTVVPVGGAGTPFVFRLSREDSGQHLGSFGLTLPPGLVANLGSVSTGSALGDAQVEAGVGPEPLHLDGTVFLDGPYEGAPYSLAIVVPAQVGPFDLGTIVERASLAIDPDTAQVTVRSDPLPTILAGVPLELRTLRIDLDRPGFVRNPTSCKPMAISGSTTTSLGQVAPLSEPFQVGGCAGLPFRPELSFRFGGAIGANGHPHLRAEMSQVAGEAGASNVTFNLPGGELLDLRRLRALCARDLSVDRCPGKSRLGNLRIETPLSGVPFEGPVYLRVPSHRLPELSADLHSGPLAFVLQGHSTQEKGRFGFSFVSIPDIPISRVVLSLPGGRNGLIVNSRSLCRPQRYGQAALSAQSGTQRRERVPVRVDGCR
jgi:hypothetical protein